MTSVHNIGGLSKENSQWRHPPEIFKTHAVLSGTLCMTSREWGTQPGCLAKNQFAPFMQVFIAALPFPLALPHNVSKNPAQHPPERDHTPLAILPVEDVLRAHNRSSLSQESSSGAL